jgi:general secretion pathway protein D
MAAARAGVCGVLIAEVNADKAAEFGIQWQDRLGSGDGIGLLAGTNFGIGGANLLNLATQGSHRQRTLPSTGLNLGVGVTHNGKLVLGALARFLQANGDGNILSTPNLLTLDNEEAKIVIGQNVPFVTGQFTNNGSASGSVNPFQTIERKDVGLTLRCARRSARTARSSCRSSRRCPACRPPPSIPPPG